MRKDYWNHSVEGEKTRTTKDKRKLHKTKITVILPQVDKMM